MVLRDYDQFGGRHCETGSLKNALTYLGVTAPHTGSPFTEEMLLGIGGGIGMSYWLFQFDKENFFFVGTRYFEKGAGAPFLQKIGKRLEIPMEVLETASAKRGAAGLENALSAGIPPVVWVDMPMLPYLGLPPDAHFGGHAIVVYGMEDGVAWIADRASRAVSATEEELAAARASRFKPFPPRHKLLTAHLPETPVSMKSLERAVVSGIGDTCRNLLRGPIKNLGLQALPKWAGLLCDSRNAKGWPKLFRKPVDLYGALMSTYIFIEIGGTGGSAFRSMYAAFLAEAAAVLKEPRLESASCSYLECARRWTDVAVAALPDWLPDLAETRTLLARKDRIFAQQPEGAVEQLERINHRLDQIVARARTAFPGPADCVPQLLAGMRDAILRLHEAELKAAHVLEDCIR